MSAGGAEGGNAAVIINDTYAARIPIHGVDISEWHNYTILWDEDTATFIIDGETVASTSPTPDLPMTPTLTFTPQHHTVKTYGHDKNPIAHWLNPYHIWDVLTLTLADAGRPELIRYFDAAPANIVGIDSQGTEIVPNSYVDVAHMGYWSTVDQLGNKHRIRGQTKPDVASTTKGKPLVPQLAPTLPTLDTRPTPRRLRETDTQSKHYKSVKSPIY